MSTPDFDDSLMAIIVGANMPLWEAQGAVAVAEAANIDSYRMYWEMDRPKIRPLNAPVAGERLAKRLAALHQMRKPLLEGKPDVPA